MEISERLIEEVGGRVSREVDGIPKSRGSLGELVCQNSLFNFAVLMKLDISSEEDLLEMGTHNEPIRSRA